MHYFFIEDQPLALGAEVKLSPEDHNHAYRVLRLKAGDKVAVADGRGTARLGTVTISEAQKVFICLDEQIPSTESPVNITLFQSLAKGEKFDLIIRQAVELGAGRIVPVLTSRSIPRYRRGQEEKKLLRWQSIVRSAAAQCRRSVLPPVETACGFEAVLPRISGRTALVPWEGEATSPIVRILQRPRPRDRAVFLFIGPEGGFTAAEIEALQERGALTVHLGSRILRTETAAVAALTLIQAAWGDLSGERNV